MVGSSSGGDGIRRLIIGGLVTIKETGDGVRVKIEASIIAKIAAETFAVRAGTSGGDVGARICGSTISDCLTTCGVIWGREVIDIAADAFTLTVGSSSNDDGSRSCVINISRDRTVCGVIWDWEVICKEAPAIFLTEVKDLGSDWTWDALLYKFKESSSSVTSGSIFSAMDAYPVLFRNRNKLLKFQNGIGKLLVWEVVERDHVLSNTHVNTCFACSYIERYLGKHTFEHWK